jgi:hypothetical protein
MQANPVFQTSWLLAGTFAFGRSRAPAWILDTGRPQPFAQGKQAALQAVSSLGSIAQGSRNGPAEAVCGDRLFVILSDE